MNLNERIEFNHDADFPLVSVIVPAFNVESYIEETLNSIKSQKYKNFEVIIVDDFSTDKTFSIASNFNSMDKRFRVMSNRRKKGVSGARNTGIDSAEGEWCVFLDSDDLWEPDTIQQRVLAAKMYPNAHFISGDYAEFTDEVSDNLIYRSTCNVFWKEHLGKALETGEPLLLSRPVDVFVQSTLTHTIAVMVRRSLILELGKFDETLSTAEDVHLWIRIAANVDSFVFAPRSLAFYRQRDGSLTHSGKSLYHDAVAAYLDLLKNPLFVNHKIQLTHQIVLFCLLNTYFYRKTGKKLQAMYWAARTLYFAPLTLLHWKNLLACLLLR